MGAIKHTKRFFLRFYTWIYEYPYGVRNSKNGVGNVKVKRYDEEADTLEEILEIKKGYLELYSDVKEPEFIGDYWIHKYTGKKTKSLSYIERSNEHDYKYIYPEYLFSDDMYFYGFAIIDFGNEKIIEVSKEVSRDIDFWKRPLSSAEHSLEIKDKLFRGDDEIPKDYKWDNGEYAGWLQYRWGNGLNAIEIEDKRNERKAIQKRLKKEKRDKEKAELLEYLKSLEFEEE